MDKLRLKCFNNGEDIKLTKEESETIGINANSRNVTWLMKDRKKLHYGHPEYPGPFTKENAENYHLYCSLEMWEALGLNPRDHWDYRETGGFSSYNPPNDYQWCQCYMCLPIAQRRRKWKKYTFEEEIFDDLSPHYLLFFD